MCSPPSCARIRVSRSAAHTQQLLRFAFFFFFFFAAFCATPRLPPPRQAGPPRMDAMASGPSFLVLEWRLDVGEVTAKEHLECFGERCRLAREG